MIDHIIEKIAALPPNVQVPGLILIAIFTLIAGFRFMTFRWIKAATYLTYAVIVAFALVRFGEPLSQWLDEVSPQETPMRESHQTSMLMGFSK